jgi:hypothetical protein
VTDLERENRRLQDELTRIIREKIETNALPMDVPLRAKSGKGDGQACSGCDRLIERLSQPTGGGCWSSRAAQPSDSCRLRARVADGNGALGGTCLSGRNLPAASTT